MWRVRTKIRNVNVSQISKIAFIIEVDMTGVESSPEYFRKSV